MKVRNGFVSNSSSSSFVVAMSKEGKPEITIKVDLTKYTDHILSTIQELNEYWGNERDEINKLYEDCRKAIEAGQIVYMGNFSDEDYGDIQCGLCHRGLKKEDMPKGAIIIRSEGGY